MRGHRRPRRLQGPDPARAGRAQGRRRCRCRGRADHSELVQRVRDEVGAVASLRQVDIVGGLPKTRSARSCARRCARWPTARRQRSGHDRGRERARPACRRAGGTPSTDAGPSGSACSPISPPSSSARRRENGLHPAYPTTWVGKCGEEAKGRRAAGIASCSMCSPASRRSRSSSRSAPSSRAHRARRRQRPGAPQPHRLLRRLPCAAPHDDAATDVSHVLSGNLVATAAGIRRPRPRMPWSGIACGVADPGAGHRVIGQFYVNSGNPASRSRPMRWVARRSSRRRCCCSCWCSNPWRSPSWTQIASGVDRERASLLVRPSQSVTFGTLLGLGLAVTGWSLPLPCFTADRA